MSNKILLVDDEETIRELFREYLSEDGFEVSVASGGKEAIELARTETFALFIIDLVMPEMDGVELIEGLRALKIDTPAVLLTAYGIELDSERNRELNVAGIIPKGMPMAEVSREIGQIIKECSTNSLVLHPTSKVNSIKRGEKKMGKEIKILVVDDEKDVLDFLKEVVESQRYIFFSARSGEEAMDKVKDVKPDMVLLDIMMPGMDGLEVLRQIRMEDKKLPVVLLTAYSTEDRVKEAIKLNVSGFIPKGTSVKDATSKIKTILKISLK